MKKVYQNTAEIAHLWVNKIQEEARNSNNNFYFDGDTIYSFGNHFPIATHYKDVILFTTKSYSSTTAKHIGIVLSASTHKDKIYCYNTLYAIQGYHNNNIEDFKLNITNHLQELDKARKPEKYINPAKYVYKQCVEYCNLFEIKVPKDITEIIESVDNGQYKKYLEKEYIRITEENKEKIRLQFLQFQNDLDKWKNGSNHNLWNNPTDIIYFRLKDGEIETSKNIKLPIPVALRYYNQLKNNKLKVGNKILDYTITEINQDTIIINCHKIVIKDFEKFIEKNNLKNDIYYYRKEDDIENNDYDYKEIKDDDSK